MVCQATLAGASRHVIDVAAALTPPRYELDVVCPRGSELWSSLAGREGVRLHAIPDRANPSPRDAWPWLRLVRLIRRADVVHAHSAKAGFLARTAALAAGRTSRCVFTPHAWSFLGFTGWRRRLYVTAERLSSRWCRIIIAVSEAERDVGVSARIGLPDQYRVILNGVDLDRFGAPPHPADGRVVMVSRLVPQKQPQLALQALSSLRRRGSTVHLVVIGDGPLHQELERLAEKLGVAEALQLLGDRKDVPEQLAMASCLLLTSSYEGCPLSVLEAMAAGVPVVATRTGGTVEVVTDGRTGFLVDSDPEAIAVGIDRLLSDPAVAAKMGAEARGEALRRFSKQRMVQAVLDVYDEVVG